MGEVCLCYGPCAQPLRLKKWLTSWEVQRSKPFAPSVLAEALHWCTEASGWTHLEADRQELRHWQIESQKAPSPSPGASIAILTFLR